MAKNTKNIVPIVAGVVVVSAGAYLLYNYFKNTKTAKQKAEEEKKTATENFTANPKPTITVVKEAPEKMFPMKKGSKGDFVRELQRALLFNGTEIDGIWGAETEKRLRLFTNDTVLDNAYEFTTVVNNLKSDPKKVRAKLTENLGKPFVTSALLSASTVYNSGGYAVTPSDRV